MAAPEWTKKHQTKGVYVGRDKTGYFLFRSHNEKDPITGKYKKVYDGFVGRITEKDGLIPSDPLGKFNDYIAMEYGLSSFILRYAKRALSRSIFNDSGHKDLIIVCAILFFMYGSYSEILYNLSYLSILYPGLRFTSITPNRHCTIIRLSGKINASLSLKVPDRDDLIVLIGLLRLYPIYKKGTIIHSLPPSPQLKRLVDKYKLEVYYANK